VRTTAVIAQASLAEHTRRRVVLFFFVASLLLTTPIVYLVRSRQFEVLSGAPLGLAAFATISALQILALIGTLAVSMGNIGRPLLSGEALTILARPVARWQYAFGRLLGSAAAVVAFCLVLAVETAVIQVVAGGNLLGLLAGYWATFAFNMLVVATIGTMISAIVANPMLVAATTFFAFEAIHAIQNVHTYIVSGTVHGSVARWFEIAWLVTPKVLPSPGGPGPLHNSAGLVAWAVAWLVALTGLTMWLASRKEL
jgi:ABC-type transport system involved in multi-copper enzyme maturation permease subunit